MGECCGAGCGGTCGSADVRTCDPDLVDNELAALMGEFMSVTDPLISPAALPTAAVSGKGSGDWLDLLA